MCNYKLETFSRYYQKNIIKKFSTVLCGVTADNISLVRLGISCVFLLRKTFLENKYIAFHSIKSGQSANFMAEFTRNVRLLLSDYFRFRHETAISFRVNLNKNLVASKGPPP